MKPLTQRSWNARLQIVLLLVFSGCRVAEPPVTTPEQILRRAAARYANAKTWELEARETTQVGKRTVEQRLLHRYRAPDCFYAAVLEGEEAGRKLSRTPGQTRVQLGPKEPVQSFKPAPKDRPLRFDIRERAEDRWQFRVGLEALRRKDTLAHVSEEPRVGGDVYHLRLVYTHRPPPSPKAPKNDPDALGHRTELEWWIRKDDGAVAEFHLSRPKAGRAADGTMMPVDGRVVVLREQIGAPLPDSAFQITQNAADK